MMCVRGLIIYGLAVFLALPMIVDSTYGVELLATDFEGSTSLPTGWTQTQVTGSATWAVQTGSGDGATAGTGHPATAHGGTNNATLFFAQYGQTTRLVSPTFSTEDHANLYLTFWHTQEVWLGDQDQLKVLYSFDGGINWTELAHYTESLPAWTERTLLLPMPSANSRIAFEGITNYGFGVCLDDVSVTGDPSGPLPEISVSASDASASETGPDAGSWTITRGGDTSGAVTVYFSLSGTATETDDYSLSHPGSISMGAGVTSAVVTLTPVDDSVFDEKGETAVLSLTANAAYGITSPLQGTVTIADNDVSELQVLIIGSTADGGDRFGGQSDPFIPTQIAAELESILLGVGLGTANVEVEERYATGSDRFGSSYSYNLASWYHWPYPADVETTTRWPNLRGELDRQWDYVVLIGDPYTMENLPGHYAHGVEMIAQEVAKGSAETVLLMPWPADGNSQSSVAHYKEVVYRAGRTGGYKVAPAGLAWEADGSQTGATHPSTRGAYICAASLYSRIWGQTASNSSYTYNDTLADLVHTTVTDNVGQPQYTGSKMNFQNPWLMLGDKRRDVNFGEKGSSTEQYYKNGAGRAMDRARVNYSHSPYCDNYTTNDPVAEGGAWTSYDLPIAWNHGRTGTGSKSYVVNPSVWQLSFTFHFQLKSRDDPDDQANDYCLARIFSSEVSLANSLKNGDSSQRNAAWRLIWGQFHKQYPGVEPVRDNSWHVAYPTEDAVGAFMYTLYSGRCPVNPGEETSQSGYARMLGYQTAWRLGTGSSRAPGFKVMPSSKTALTVTPTTTETMTVQFLFPPRNDVTVQISSSDTSAAIVGTQTLVFTPSNYNVPQPITVAGVSGATASAPFTVDYTTTSDDPAYDGLSDSWAYTTTRTATTVTHVDNGTTQYTTPKNFPVTTNLNAPGATSGNTAFAGPNHGTLSWSGSDVVYTPDTDYIGSDGFAYWSLNGSTVTTGYIHIDVVDGYPAGSVRAETTDAEATEAGTTTGTWSVIREGSTAGDLVVYFSLSGTAVPGDYSIDSGSPITIPDGQSSVTVTLTPVDDTEREFPEMVTLTIAADAAYTAITNPATITITDDDNTPPEVNAGPDQNVSLSGTSSWTPASTPATKAWYDASDAGTITASGSAVSLWSDKSGNDYHLSGPAGSEPMTGIRTIGGINAVDFQGGDLLSIGNRLGFGTNPDIMAFIVMERDGGDSTIFNFGTGVDKIRTGTYGNTLGWYYEGGNEKYGAAPTGTPFVSCWQRPNGGNYASASYFHNGTELARTGGGNDTKVPTDSSSQFSFGADHDASGTLNASVAEVVFVESNDVDLRQNMEGYLAHKWGLAGNLPADHPYKSAAPGASSVTVNLDGTVNDIDGDTLTTVWTVVSTDPAGLPVTIDDPSAVDTTATFYTAGTYVLRLTADDGTDVVYDECVITVSDPGVLPEITVTATDAAAAEAGQDPGIWTISRTGDTTDPLVVNFTLGGTATPTADYTINPTSPVTIPAGVTSITVTLTPVDDGDKEDAETAKIIISPVAGYAIGASEEITILDNDNIPPVVDAGVDQTVPLTGGPTVMLIAPTDPIQGFQSTSVGGNSTDGSNWPAAENPPKAIDGSTSTKYLNFGKVGSGFYITPAIGLSTLTGIKIYTANDAPGRDPLTVSIEGANGGDLSQGSSWTLIANNVNLGIDTDPGRRTAGPLVDIADAGAFTSYRIIAQSMRNAGDNSIQYSEIELHGVAGSFTIVTLDGTVTDVDDPAPTTTWTVVSTVPAGLESTVTFADASAIDTTATFTELGVYTLRLTANDGNDTVYDECVITVGTGGGPIADVSLPAGISLYGYTGENPIDAQTAFQPLIDNSQLSQVRWVNPTNGQIKELYYTTFPSAGWVNEIGDLTLCQGYVVKTTAACTLSISGNKSTVSVSLDLPAGYSIIGFNKETPMDAQTAFQPLIDAGKLELVRWVDPSNGQIKELYYTTFPSEGWVNEIGDLTEAQGYIIKLNAAQTGFTLP